MSTNNSSTTSSTSYEKIPASECIPWIVFLIIESLAITILNIITIVVFRTQRQLKRRGTYLLMRNLAIVDLLVGVVSGPLQIERVGESCDVWEYDTTFTWGFLMKFALLHLFSFASLANLVAISLERMHATFFPSRHFLMNKRVYYIIVAAIWLIAIIREIIQTAFLKIPEPNFDRERMLNSTLYVAFYLISLLFVCLSYVSIFVKIRFGPHINPLSNCVIIRERQLTSTLFAVTVASLLSLLPVILFLSVFTFRPETQSQLSHSSVFHITMIALIFFLGNSLANPVIYSMRMQGFRAGLENLFCITPSHNDAAALPLTRRNK